MGVPGSRPHMVQSPVHPQLPCASAAFRSACEERLRLCSPVRRRRDGESQASRPLNSQARTPRAGPISGQRGRGAGSGGFSQWRAAREPPCVSCPAVRRAGRGAPIRRRAIGRPLRQRRMPLRPCDAHARLAWPTHARSRGRVRPRSCRSAGPMRPRRAGIAASEASFATAWGECRGRLSRRCVRLAVILGAANRLTSNRIPNSIFT